MYSFRVLIFYLVVLNTLISIQGLVELPLEDETGITVTDTIVKNTVNHLFSSLKLGKTYYKSRLKEFSAIHNFFSSISLTDRDNLKEVKRLAKAEENIYNSSQIMVESLNELLNEDHKSVEAIEDENISEYIGTFLDNLRTFKEEFDLLRNDKGYKINKEILNIMGRNYRNVNDSTAEINDEQAIYDELEVWQPSGRRVYRGKRTKAKYFPFMASIQFFRKFQCAGSIIKSDLIITAASCLQLAYNNRFFRENPAFLSVRVGSNYIEYGGDNIPALEVYFHPGYDPKTLRDNLCLLRLRRHIIFRKRSPRVKKIDIDRDPSMLPENTDGITIVGWGAKSSRNILESVRSNQMLYDVLDFYPLPECQERYSREYVTKKNFCAGFFSKGGGACNRDVGGPGMVKGYLAGVVSFGSPVCGAYDAPTVFTKVGYYADWIDEVMEMEVPITNPLTTLKPPYPPITIAVDWVTKPTTFKISPIGLGKIKTKQIVDDSGLRNKEETEIFAQFLKTIFGDDEVQEDDVEKIRNELESEDETVPAVVTNDDDQTNIKSISPKSITTNVIPYYDSQEEVTESTLKSDDDNDSDLEKDIMRLIEDLDVTSLLLEAQKQNLNSTESKQTNPKKVDSLQNDDEVLTLLYLSDSERNNSKGILSKHEKLPSRPIETAKSTNTTTTKHFKDLTYRNKKYMKTLTQADLLEIIAQAISSEIKNKD